MECINFYAKKHIKNPNARLSSTLFRGIGAYPLNNNNLVIQNIWKILFPTISKLISQLAFKKS